MEQYVASLKGRLLAVFYDRAPFGVFISLAKGEEGVVSGVKGRTIKYSVSSHFMFLRISLNCFVKNE